VRWLAPTLCVARHEREAVGRANERYAWTRILVAGYRDGRVTSLCTFDSDAEPAAFAYAEERLRTATGQLAVSNRASEIAASTTGSMRVRDGLAASAAFSEGCQYDDRRKLSGESVVGTAGLLRALGSAFEQFTEFELHPVAVRGERLALSWSRWSDDAGNEAISYYVFELGDDARISYAGRFDEDDFEGAYQELERRHYVGEGVWCAESGSVLSEILIAMNRNEFDRMFAELVAPDFHVDNRVRTAFPKRSAEELRASFDDLGDMVSSVRTWLSAIRWPTSSRFVARMDREAVGPDGERYEWSRLVAGECRAGRLASLCEFELDDAEHAFAYAEQT
jgi:hypothetical protein